MPWAPSPPPLSATVWPSSQDRPAPQVRLALLARLALQAPKALLGHQGRPVHLASPLPHHRPHARPPSVSRRAPRLGLCSLRHPLVGRLPYLCLVWCHRPAS